MVVKSKKLWQTLKRGRMLFLFTAFSVSIDAYVAGLAYSIGNKPSLKHVAYVLIFTFIISLIALFVGRILSAYELFFKVFSALLFVFLGVKNLLIKEEKSDIVSAPIIGMGVGLDAGVACLSFAVSTCFAFAIALVMSVFHGVFFLVGKHCALLLKTAKRTSVACGILLIMLGIYKLI